MHGPQNQAPTPLTQGYPAPTAQVATYVELLGPAKTVEFLLAFGGAELALSNNPRADSALAQMVGEEGARALGAHAHRLPKRVPLAKKWLTQALASQGLPVAQIARTLRASDVSVRKWLEA